MNKVGAKKRYDGEWWNDMMVLPKAVLVAALERANRRADKAEASASTSHNSESAPLICDCGDHITGDYAFVGGKYLCPVCMEW